MNGFRLFLVFRWDIMDQQSLRELEKRCIQEEPPYCTAACPLHVDVRSFVGQISLGEWENAWKILDKSMPMAGILGRICDAPCERHCKRSEVDQAIAIGALERACVEAIERIPKVLPMPAKPKRIAVIGSGLSSLTVAWDLGRKGYRITIFEPEARLAAPLYRLNPMRLPPEVIQVQTQKLEPLGIEVVLNTPLKDAQTWDKWLNGFDALYFGWDAVSLNGFDLQNDKVFSGGDSNRSRNSPVFQTAEGRWAATSIDRFLQNVSMTAGREKEGPQATRLFTCIAGVPPAPRVSVPDDGYLRAEAQREAGRCLQCECLECVKVCAYLKSFNSYPKKYAREIYNNAAIVMGERKANKLINSCSLCGLCERVCPNGFAMQDLCLSARKDMVAKGKMPPSAHEFALIDLAFNRSDVFSLTRHQPGKSSSAFAFFPGCQLCASAPGQVEATYRHLTSTLPGGVGLMLGCCGAPAFWAGQEALFLEVTADIKKQWLGLGKPRLVTACSTCYRIFKNHLPEVPVVSLWAILAEDQRLLTNQRPERSPLAIHDPCTTRDEPEIRQSVRTILKELDVGAEELGLAKDLTECCGYGGLMQTANPDLAREVAVRRADLSASDYIAYCAMCRDNLAAAGKRTVHLLDLLFPDKNHPDPAARPRPGWSERQENRRRLKAHLLTRLWKAETAPMEPHLKIQIHMTPEVAKRLEIRRILMEDVQRVVHHAEASGEKMVHPKSGHFKAAFTPYKVTFWVEYSAERQGGYTLHNAYAHRMEVMGP